MNGTSASSGSVSVRRPRNDGAGIASCAQSIASRLAQAAA